MTTRIDVVFATMQLGGASAPPLALALAPKRAFAPVAVATPRGVRHAALGGLPGVEHRLAIAAEIALIRPTESPRPRRAAPLDAVLAGMHHAAEAMMADPPAASRLLLDLWGPPRLTAPLLYCRRCGRIAQARALKNGAPLLRRADVSEQTAFAPLSLLTESGDSDVEAVRAVLLDQGRLIALGPSEGFESQRAEDEWLSEHPCASDRDRARWDPDRGAYPYAEEWLTPVSYAAAPLLIERCPATALEIAAAAAAGGPAPSGLPFVAAPPAVAARPAFEREPDERATLAALQARLRMVEPLLSELDRRYRALRRAYVEWSADAAGFALALDAATEATASPAGRGRALLRGSHYAPVEPAEFQAHSGAAFAPEGVDVELLPDGVAEVLAAAESEHRAVFLLRAFGKRDEKQSELTAGLIDVSPLRGASFMSGDRIEIAGGGGRAVLTPTGQTSTDDGAGGVAVRGRLFEAWAKLQRAGEIDGCSVRWSPRLGEAIDLHAVGVRMLDCLLFNDASDVEKIRRGVAQLRSTLESQCRAEAPPARPALFERLLDAALAGCSADDLWSSRAVQFERNARAAANAGPLCTRYWRAACAFGLRLSTQIAGVSYCADRATDAPRDATGALLPWVELRGLIALIDDVLLARRAMLSRP